MTWDLPSNGEVDANSPMHTILWGKIKDCLEWLKSAVDINSSALNSTIFSDATSSGLVAINTSWGMVWDRFFFMKTSNIETIRIQAFINKGVSGNTMFYRFSATDGSTTVYSAEDSTGTSGEWADETIDVSTLNNTKITISAEGKMDFSTNSMRIFSTLCSIVL